MGNRLTRHREALSEKHRPRGSAVIDHTGRYRYSLERVWGDESKPVCWIMLNPSTADAERDDPTIRRCIGFSWAWGYGSLVIVNLFAWRASDPRDLRFADDPIGPENDRAISRAVTNTDLVVAAWGVPPSNIGHRDQKVRRDVEQMGRSLHNLGLTKGGHPRHPLYLYAGTPLERWEGLWPPAALDE